MRGALSPARCGLLDRNGFLGHLGSELGGVALLSLLAEERLPADGRGRLRPLIRPEAPLAPRPPHFAPKARRVVHVFCSGACSHLDTFDYKPELPKRDG